MSRPLRAICIHGHYYQPPREHPWLGVVEPEPSAGPDRDWNARILRECYAPNAAARLLDAHGRLRGLVDNYAWTSFDVGPTLLGWLGSAAPELVDALRRADAESRARTGFGNAWAQAYSHPILPLCSERDLRTQVRWGARAFTLRFERAPDGMWLPEMAADLRTLEALAAEGITLTMLSPHQARRVRPLDGDEGTWRDVSAETLDVRRLYRCRLPSGRHVDILFREASVSQGLAYGELLRDGGTLAARLRSALESAEGDAIIAVATDGETFGHHHRFGEMAVAYAIDSLRTDPALAVTNPAAFRATCPPSNEVEIVENTSWSCVHGIERWRSACACRVGGPPEWTTAWRSDLRVAVDWLRDALSGAYEEGGGEALRDPWGARDRYVDCVVEPRRVEDFLAGELRPGTDGDARVHARRCLEMARHALLMQTSCGWFFDDLAGVEAVLVMRQAARAIELAGALGASLESGFLDRLANARSNVETEGTGADIYQRVVHGRTVSPARIAATGVLLRRLGEEPVLAGYTIDPDPDGTEITVGVTERATGAHERVRVLVDGEGARSRCRVGGAAYALADLFLVQREALLRRVADEAVRAARQARHEALARLRGVIDPLLAREPALPLELAMLLGYEEADLLVEAARARRISWSRLAERAATLRRRGVVLPAQWLGRNLVRHLERSAQDLPASIDDALGVLDLAEAAGVVVDLAATQLAVARWWLETRPASPEERLVRLRDRLGLSPELGA